MAPGSTGTGQVDLSLPSYAELSAQAGNDPRREAARVASAEPDAVFGSAQGFASAGLELDTAYRQGTRAAELIGASFTNNGAAVYGVPEYQGGPGGQLPPAAARLEAASGALGKVAQDLSTTRTETSTAVDGLISSLAEQASGWQARVAAAGLIPLDQVPAWQAERDALAQAMVGQVRQVGGQVSTRIQAYEGVVRQALGLFTDQGFAAPADLNAVAPAAPRLEGAADPAGLGVPVTAGLAADPVTTGLGNFVEVEPDLVFGGLLAGLSLERTYNSRSDRSGPFGPGWSCWATTGLTDRGWAVEYTGPDGQRVLFGHLGRGTYQRANGVNALLAARPAGGWTLSWFDGDRWEFDPGGRLTRVTSGPGTRVDFGHDETGRLTRLTHERGRHVLVEWGTVADEQERIVALHAADGRRIEYRYTTDAGFLAAVDAVTDVGPVVTRRYEVDEASGRVLSVTDADGVVEVINTYDERGRVLTQLSPFGRLVTFTYQADGSTVVADDSAGPRNVYRHDSTGRLTAVTDGHGRTQRICYDEWGNRIEVVRRGGGVTRQEFDQRGHPVRRWLPGGAVQALTWDDQDRVEAVTTSAEDCPTATVRFTYAGTERVPHRIVDPEGGVTGLEVVDGLIRAETDPDGVTRHFRHDRDGNLVEAHDAADGVTRIERDPDTGLATAITSPAGRRTEFTHDAFGRIVARRDPDGALWRFTFTRAGRPAAIIDPLGERTETRYGPHGHAAELVDELGLVTRQRFDTFGNLSGIVDPDGTKWSFTFDALSRLASWAGPTGGSWLTDHDPDGNLTATTDPTGVRRQFDHDPVGNLTGTEDGLVRLDYTRDSLGRVTTEIRPDGTTRHLAYDRCNRLTSRTDFTGGVTRYAYTPAGRLLETISPAGRTRRFTHDPTGRPSTVVDGNGEQWRTSYDPDGLPTARTTPTGLTETLDHDACARLTRHRRPGVGTTAWEYGPRNEITAITDRNGRRTFTHDARGLLVAVTDALGHTTGYTRNLRGDVVTVTDPLGGVTRYTHDEHSRVTSVTDPLGRSTHYTYDPAGRLLEHREPTGHRHRYRYDRSGRRIEHSVTPGGDTAPRWRASTTHDRLGRPVRIVSTDPDGGGVDQVDRVDLAWDAAGRLIAQRGPHTAIGWTYDADGHRTGRTDPDGTVTRYRHDDAGRLVELTHPLLGEIRLTRDRDGLLTEITDSAVTTRLGYRGGWLSTHTSTDHAGRRRHGTRLSRDHHGRITHAATAATGSDADSIGYRYDPAGQLTAAEAPDQRWTFGYDQNGRLHTETGPAGTTTRTYDPAGQLLTSTGPDGASAYTYDPSGRRTGEHTPAHQRDYDYDPLTGQPAAITTTPTDGPTRTVRYRHNPLGQLAAVDDQPVTWDTADPAEPLLGLGDHSVINTGSPWATAGAGSTEHLHPQHTGTPAQMHRHLDPWGVDLGGGGVAASGPGPMIGHRGELRIDTDLIWLRARTYQPGSRSFLQTDPLPPIPGTPYAANPYHYAGNDPVNSHDPTGLRPATDSNISASDIGHTVLDVIGLVPGLGEAADLANAAWYALEGNYGLAALSAAAAIPILGAAATAGKFGVKAARAADALVGAATTAGTAIRGGVTNLAGRVAGPVTNAANGVVNGARQLGNTIGSGLNNALGGLAGGPRLAGAGAGDLGPSPAMTVNTASGGGSHGVRSVSNASSDPSPTGTSQDYYRGAKPGEPPSFAPRETEYKVDQQTGYVKPTHGVSVFDNPESVSRNGYVSHAVDQSTVPDDLHIIQRGRDSHHYEIVPTPGANLAPENFAERLSQIRTRS
jgi:RHS repeat-associated protein